MKEDAWNQVSRTQSLKVGPPETLGLAAKTGKQWVNTFVAPGKEIQPRPWVQIFKWPLQAVCLASKYPQLFKQPP